MLQLEFRKKKLAKKFRFKIKKELFKIKIFYAVIDKKKISEIGTGKIKIIDLLLYVIYKKKEI